MSKYRNRLPQLTDRLFMTDGGLETTLIYHDGIPLPSFAAFDLLKDTRGTAVLRKYFLTYADLAREHGVGLVLETPTWRANSDWATPLGYDAAALADANRRGVGLLLEIRAAREHAETPIVVSGNIGPRGDGYRPEKQMTIEQARDYHGAQIATFAATDADMVAAFTMNYVEEAIGVVRAARDHAMPVAISFTVETDGKLPSGEPLADAIERTDAETSAHAIYYMINCAHPSHFEHVLDDASPWRARVRGLRANASKRSHAELDQSTDLDAGNPVELGQHYANLRHALPRLNVIGGCCGTDHRHVDAMCRAVRAAGV